MLVPNSCPMAIGPCSWPLPGQLPARLSLRGDTLSLALARSQTKRTEMALRMSSILNPRSRTWKAHQPFASSMAWQRPPSAAPTPCRAGIQSPAEWPNWHWQKPWSDRNEHGWLRSFEGIWMFSKSTCYAFVRATYYV